MKITGKKSWIHKARKERETEVDLPEKSKVLKILFDHFKLYGTLNEVVLVPSGPLYPDILIKRHEPQIAIELDGLYHGWGDDITTSTGTYKRNAKYAESDVKLIIISKAVTEYDDGLIIEALEAHGLERKCE